MQFARTGNWYSKRGAQPPQDLAREPWEALPPEEQELFVPIKSRKDLFRAATARAPTAADFRLQVMFIEALLCGGLFSVAVLSLAVSLGMSKLVPRIVRRVGGLLRRRGVSAMDMVVLVAAVVLTHGLFVRMR